MGLCYLIKNGGFYLTPEEVEDIKGFSWRANSKTENGYVVATDGAANKVYGTDEEGNPGWIDYTPQVEVVQATDEVAGIMKLYGEEGESDDGTMTQQAISQKLTELTTLLNTKADLVEGKVKTDQLPEHLITGEEDGSLPAEIKVDADTLQGYDAEYFAAASVLENYIPVSEKDSFATKDDLEGYIPTSKETTFATKEDLDNIDTLKIEVSEMVPNVETAQKDIIYLVPRQDEESDNKYDEYVLANDAIEKIGGGLSEKQIKELIPKISKYNINAESLEWTPNGEIFKALFTVEELNASGDDYSVIADLIQTDDEEQNVIARENWNSIVRMTLEGKQITFYSEKEFDNINLQLLVFYTGSN